MNIDQRIRVAHVTFGLDVGGLEKLLVQFAKHADVDRYHLTIASLGHIGPIGEQLRLMNVPVVCMHRADGFHPSLIGQLYRFFRKVRADVAHTHDPRPLIYAAPAARLAGVRSIIHTQHGRAFGSSPRQNWLIRQASKMTHHFVGVSKDIAEMSIENGVERRKVSIIRNGIGGDDFVGTDTDIQYADRPYVVCVARLSPEKGVSTLVDAAAEAVRREPDMQVIIAGDGICRIDLQTQIEDHGISDQVHLIGQTDRVADLLRKARVFVLPSNSEGVSLTLLEAMFARVPIVATNVGGTPEVIQDGVNGLLVPPKEPDAMADAIVDLWNDARSCERLAGEGFLVAQSQFGIDKMLRQYELLYEANLSERRRADAYTDGEVIAT